MRHIKSFNDKSIYEFFHLDKEVIDTLIDICDSFDVDLHIRALMDRVKNQIMWVEIYDSRDWSIDGNRFLYFHQHISLSSFKQSECCNIFTSVKYDIIGDWDSISDVYNRIKSEFDISLDEMFVVDIFNVSDITNWTRNFKGRETYFIESGKVIPVNSAKKLAWIPFSINS